MHLDTTLIAAIAALLVSIVTLWSNPRRAMNRSFFGLSLLVMAWLLALRQTFAVRDGVLWLRIASALGAAIVPQLWLMMDIVVNPLSTFRRRFKRLSPLLVIMVGLAGLSFSAAFIPPESTAAKPIYGWGYYVYLGVLGIGYIAVVAMAIRAMRRQVGIQRVELQLLLTGGGAAGLAGLGIITISSIMRSTELIRTLPLTVIAFYSGTAWIMTTTKLFDARQVLRVLSQQLAVVAVVAFAGWWIFQGLVIMVPAPLAAFLSVAIALPISEFFAGRLKQFFNLHITADRRARRAAYEASRKAVRVDLLEESFAEVLRASCQTDRAAVLFGEQDKVEGGGLRFPRIRCSLTSWSILNGPPRSGWCESGPRGRGISWRPFSTSTSLMGLSSVGTGHSPWWWRWGNERLGGPTPTLRSCNSRNWPRSLKMRWRELIFQCERNMRSSWRRWDCWARVLPTKFAIRWFRSRPSRNCCLSTILIRFSGKSFSDSLGPKWIGLIDSPFNCSIWRRRETIKRWPLTCIPFCGRRWS